MSVPLLPADQVAELVEAVARRVVELLDEREGSFCTGLVDAATLARILGVTRSTVYEHADELGGVRLGDGPRGRLRFDVEKARAAWTLRDTSEKSQQPDPPAPVGAVRRRRRRPAGQRDGLLPVHGGEAA